MNILLQVELCEGFLRSFHAHFLKTVKKLVIFQEVRFIYLLVLI